MAKTLTADTSMPEDDDDDVGVKTLLWAIVWLLLLLFIGWWIGFLCAYVYVIILPFNACIPQLTELRDVFLKGQNIPLYFAKFMIDGTPMNEVKFSD